MAPTTRCSRRPSVRPSLLDLYGCGLADVFFNRLRLGGLGDPFEPPPPEEPSGHVPRSKRLSLGGLFDGTGCLKTLLRAAGPSKYVWRAWACCAPLVTNNFLQSFLAPLRPSPTLASCSQRASCPSHTVTSSLSLTRWSCSIETARCCSSDCARSHLLVALSDLLPSLPATPGPSSPTGSRHGMLSTAWVLRWVGCLATRLATSRGRSSAGSTSACRLSPAPPFDRPQKLTQSTLPQIPRHRSCMLGLGYLPSDLPSKLAGDDVVVDARRAADGCRPPAWKPGTSTAACAA